MAPSFFIGHGSPMLAIENNAYTHDLNRLGQSLGKPDAVVVFSAHWVSRRLSVTYTDGQLETIHDFGGFPRELYEVIYPAKGSVQVAEEVAQLFEKHGIEVNRDTRYGLDHGSWVPLRHLFPDANVPVIGVSVNPLLPPAEQYRIGQAIGELKNRNIVIIGSGGSVHNFRTINFANSDGADDWAKQFDDWLVEHMQQWDTASLFDYRNLAPHAAMATPDYEHFLPVFLAMGTGDDKRTAKLLHQSYRYGSLSHLLLEFE